MKNKLLAGVLSLGLLSSGIFQSHKSEAALIGAFTANVPLIVVGSAVALYVPVNVGHYCQEHNIFLCMLTSLAAAPLFVGGLLLDQETQSLNYYELSDEEAKKIGLSQVEVDAYHSQIDEINLLKEEIQEQILSRSEKSNLEAKEAAKLAHSLWKEYGHFLKADSMRAVEKISAQFHE